MLLGERDDYRLNKMKIKHRRGVDHTEDGTLGETVHGLLLGMPGDGMNGNREAHNNINKEKAMHGKEIGEDRYYNSYIFQVAASAR